MSIQVHDSLNELSVSTEHLSNLTKIAEMLIDSVAFGSVKEDEEKTAEYMNHLSTIIHIMMRISEYKSDKIQRLLQDIVKSTE